MQVSRSAQPDVAISSSRTKKEMDGIHGILRSFASRRFGVKKAQESQVVGGPSMPQVAFQMVESSVTARNGDVALNIGCVTQNFYAQRINANHDQAPPSTELTTRPKLFDKLPKFSRWDIDTEEWIEDTGSCRVYAAKVDGKPAIVKEFYGKEAQKAWIVTAKVHAATRLAPQVLRLIGASNDSEATDDAQAVGLPPFLVFDSGFTIECLGELWMRETNPDLSITTTRLLRLYLLYTGMLETYSYLESFQSQGSTLPKGVGLYYKFRSIGGFMAVQPTIDFQCSEGEDSDNETVSHGPIMMMEKLFLGALSAASEAVTAHLKRLQENNQATCNCEEPHFGSNHPSIMRLCLCSPEADALWSRYNLVKHIYPECLVLRDLTYRSRLTIVCLLEAREQPSDVEIIQNAFGKGLIDIVEFERLVVHAMWPELFSDGADDDSLPYTIHRVSL